MKRRLLVLACLASFATSCTSPSTDKPLITRTETLTLAPPPASSVIPPAPTAIVPRIVRGSPSCFERSEIAVQNPGFEGGGNLPSDWVSSNDAGYTFARAADSALDGNASAYIKGKDDAPPGYPNFAQTLPLANPTGSLRLNARVRTRGVAGGWGAFITINYLDANKVRIFHQESDNAAAGDTTDWQYLAAIGDIPGGTRYISITLVLNGHGEAWFDSISLIRIQGVWNTNPPAGTAAMTLTGGTVQEPFFGFGVQNNPYLYYGPANPDVTEADFGLIETRISKLQPRLARVFFQPGWWDSSPDTPMIHALIRTLQLYGGIGSEINLAMQTTGMEGWTEDQVLGLVPKVAGLLEYLIRTKGLTHIRYLTLYNEPNVEFKLPQSAYVRLYQKMSEALQKTSLPVGLIGVDEVNNINYFYEMVPQVVPFVDAFSYHDYGANERHVLFIERVRDHLEYTTASGGGKPLFIWEFGIKGENATTPFTPGEITPGVLIIDDYKPMLGLAQDALYGMNQGVAGFSYWEVYDMQYGGNQTMTIGLWAYKDEGWRFRPFYYLYGLLTRLTQSGAAVVEVSPLSCDQALPVAAVRNPDGTRTVYVINPSQREVAIRLTGLPDIWKPTRYLITEAIVAGLIKQSALFSNGTAYGVSSGQLVDQLPPHSMVAYSDAP